MSKTLFMPDFDNANGNLPLSKETQYLNALLYGGKCLGYFEITFGSGAAIPLPTIPDGAQTAIIYIEAGVADVDKGRVARYREDNAAPTAAAGMPIGDDGVMEITGRANLDGFKIIGINGGVTHTLRVQYYGQG